ncbi:MAG: hypothetical protein LKE40_02650 [Spirochaetia bacterium]|nr:hypothetical protein [Spirochaetia bacterium]
MEKNNFPEMDVRKKKRGEKRRRKKKGALRKDGHERSDQGRKLLPSQDRKQFHGTLPDTPIKSVVEPRPDCLLCGKTIENIAEAVSAGENGFYHFDCIMDKIKEEEHLGADEKLSYIGEGNFGIFTTDAEGKLILQKKINVESPETYQQMKQYVENQKQ